MTNLLLIGCLALPVAIWLIGNPCLERAYAIYQAQQTASNH
jgi:hypothetical protein